MVYDSIAAYIGEHGLEHIGATRELYLGREHFADEIEVVWPVAG